MSPKWIWLIGFIFCWVGLGISVYGIIYQPYFRGIHKAVAAAYVCAIIAFVGLWLATKDRR